jgi:hypothetical protein
MGGDCHILGIRHFYGVIAIMIKNTKEQFTKVAEKNWNLEKLYTDLAKAKGKNLTQVEKLHLCGLLCGFSPAEIAEKRQKNAAGLSVDLSNTLYQYIKVILNQERIENWRCICQWLEEAGYKNQIVTQSNQSIPVDAKVHISNINIENQTIEIGVLLQLPLSLLSETLEKD